MAINVEQLRELAELYDQWQTSLALPPDALAAEQDRLQRAATLRGAEFANAFATMIKDAAIDGGATTLLPLTDGARNAAVVASLSAGDAAPRTPISLDAQPPSREAGHRVGPYRLIKEIGRGGMGVVWLAARADGQHERQVALKMPLVENLNWLLAARFARERNILASLEHPGIARLYDAGVDSETQPYIALEYVLGVPINEYVRDQRLKPEATVALFTKVINAVSHAHAQLVIHRDIKPSNILVDAQGEPHLLDFGIAKLLDDEDSMSVDATQLTRMSGRALTLDYASPEQVNGQTLGTASDVYALGVVLYELLTGNKPYAPKGPTRRDLELAIVEQEPAKPSDRLALTGTSEAGKTARRIRGDLDTVVLKALRKDPKQRYATAQAFADDLKRYLAYEPIAAKPDAGWYRLGRFVRRNRVAVGGALLLTAVGAMGVTSTIWQATLARAEATRANVESRQKEREAARANAAAAEAQSQARRADEQAKNALNEKDRADSESAAAQRASANATRSASEASAASASAQRSAADAAAQRDVAINQRTIAQSEATRARVVSDFLSGLFRASSTHQVDPVAARAVTAAELLARGAERADEALRGDPLAREEVWRTVGEIYLQLGEQKKSGELTRKRYASVLARGADPRDTVQAGIDLANVFYENGETKQMSDLVFSLLETAKKLSPSADASLLGATAFMEARALEATHQRDAAEAPLRKAIDYFRAAVKAQPNTDLSVYVHALRYLATFLAARNRGSEALTFFDEAVEYLAPRKAKFPTVAAALEGGRGNILRRLARDREATKAYENSIAMYRQAVPEGHVGEVYVNEYLADVLANLGEFDRAERHVALALAGYARFLPNENEDLASAKLGFAEITRKSGRAADACSASLSLLKASAGKPDEGRVLSLRGDQVVGQCIDSHRLDDAQAVFTAIQTWQRNNPQVRAIPQLHFAWARLAAAQGDWAAARHHIATAMLTPPRADAPVPPSWMDVLILKCRIELGGDTPQGCDEALGQIDRALKQSPHLRDRPLLFANFKEVQGRWYSQTNRGALAVAALREAIDVLARTQVADSVYLESSRRALSAIEAGAEAPAPLR